MWNCPRSQFVWLSINNIIRTVYNVNYLTYNNIVLGSPNPIKNAELLILLGLKLIMSKERTNDIRIETIHSNIKTLYFLEKQLVKNRSESFELQWEKINTAILAQNNQS